MDDPWRIQLAFQGGGARFINMLAVAEAFQDLEKNTKQIEITRVAGTSAGSLVAALLAANIPISEAADLLEKRRGKYTRALAPDLSRVGKAKMAWKFLRSEPLLDRVRLKKVVDEVWAELCLEKRRSKFSDLEKPIIVVAADVLHRSPKEFDSSSDPIVPCLLDSCAIPIAYRTLRDFESNQYLVDGGLVENLPIGRLLDEREEFGEVFAVSFDDSALPTEPRNQLEYIFSLFDIAIRNQIDHVKRRLDPRKIFLIDSPIGTFDFDRAFREWGSNTKNYASLKLKASNWMRHNRDVLFRGVDEAAPSPVSRKPSASILMKMVQDVYIAQHSNTKYNASRRAIIIEANSIFSRTDPENPRSRLADYVRQIYEVSPVDDTLYCIGLRLDWGGQSAPNAARSVTVRDAKGNSIVPIVVPIDDAQDRIQNADAEVSQEFQHQEAILFFNPPILPKEKDRFPIEILDETLIENVMVDLADKGTDFMSIHNQAKVPYKVADLVLFVPKDTPSVQVSWKDHEDSIVFRSGENLEEQDLRKYDRFLSSREFRSMGWRTNELAPGQRFYANLFIKNWIPSG